MYPAKKGKNNAGGFLYSVLISNDNYVIYRVVLNSSLRSHPRPPGGTCCSPRKRSSLRTAGAWDGSTANKTHSLASTTSWLPRRNRHRLGPHRRGSRGVFFWKVLGWYFQRCHSLKGRVQVHFVLAIFALMGQLPLLQPWSSFWPCHPLFISLALLSGT